MELSTDNEHRPLLAALGKGARCRCPRCGSGRLFRAFLKVNDACPACGEALHHHRADDMPPYISIFIVGHIIIGVLLHLEMTTQVAPWLYMVTLLPAAVILPLALLPSIKGMVVALQWANRMHGFDPTHRDPAAPDAVI